MANCVPQLHDKFAGRLKCAAHTGIPLAGMTDSERSALTHLIATENAFLCLVSKAAFVCGAKLVTDDILRLSSILRATSALLVTDNGRAVRQRTPPS